MSLQPDIERLARRIKAAQDEGRQVEPLTDDDETFDLANAYAVAGRIHETRLAEGATPVGRKIGFTNSNIWPKYGVDAPVWGYVYDTTVTRVSGGRSICGAGRFVQPKIEPEIVVHFREAPPIDGDDTAFLDCIDWVAHGFEIVQCHYPGWRFRAPDAVADSALHGALLVGEPVAVEALGAEAVKALASFSITLSREGDVVETGSGGNVLGSPLKAVAHLAATLATQPDGPALTAGEIVTTGTLTGAWDIEAGQQWSTEIEGIGLPGLSVRVEA